MTVEGRTIITDMKSGKTRDAHFQADADDAVVDDAYRRKARIISPQIAHTYTMKRANLNPEAKDDLDDALIESREDVAALHLLENLEVLFDAKAKMMSDGWFAKYHGGIKKLPHDRQDSYRQIVALSTKPEDVPLARPVSRFEQTKISETSGVEIDIPTYKAHMLCDEKGLYPAKLRGGESKVVTAESKRKGFKFWYWNPSCPSQDSLGIAYTDADVTKIVRPDFIFFAEQDGKVVANIVDPHGFYLADAVPKLQGLAHYVEMHPGVLRRVETIAEVGGKLRYLDLTRADVRKAVMDATSAETLYGSKLASDYPANVLVGKGAKKAN